MQQNFIEQKVHSGSCSPLGLRDINRFFISRIKALWGIRAVVQGFTLIELLVVVLIIGILTAIAVPQYRITVAKSSAMAMIPFARALVDAQERYYMANGKYGKQNDLDISLPGNCKFVNGHEIICGTDWMFNNHTDGTAKGYLNVVYCPAANTKGSTTCHPGAVHTLNFYYQHHESKAGEFVCVSKNGAKFCKTFEALFQK